LVQQAEATTFEPAAIPQPTSNNDDQDLFRFVKQNARTETTTQVHSIDQEIEAYLCSPIPAHHHYYSVHTWSMHAFLKYNAALPSGAAVERLFICT